jgi:DNA replication licensing factor MCM3
MHSYRQPGTEEGAPVRETQNQTLGIGIEDTTTANKTTEIYEKYNPVIHAGLEPRRDRRGRMTKDPVTPISMAFIKKYIQYSKTRCKPQLTKEASDYVVKAYSDLRNNEMQIGQRRTAPMTARTLETLIRLSTAHAKARLSARVEEEDAVVAEQVLKFALFKEVPVKEDRRKRRKVGKDKDVNMDSDDSSEEESEDSDDDDGDDGAFRGAKPRQGAERRATRSQPVVNGTNGANRTANGGGEEEDDDEEEDEEEEEEAPQSSSRRTQISRSQPSSNNNNNNNNNNTAAVDSQLSNLSIASSIPSSQLPPTQTDSQLSQTRLTQFRSILGQLRRTNLFQNDMAKMEDVMAAVNGRLMEADDDAEEFDEQDTKQALEWMGEKNEIMWLEESGEVYTL